MKDHPRPPGVAADAPADFKFPKPPGSLADFTWDGRQFVSGAGERCDILCYTETQSNWSDELTRMHEQEGGSQHPIDKSSRSLAIESIRAHCAEPAPTVLEVGCSSGFFLEELVSRLPRAAAIGADYIGHPLRRLVDRLEGVPILQFDLRSCPLPDQSIDAVVCLNVLEHIDDHVAALGHIFRILKPGGIAHLEVPAGPALYDIYDELLMHHRRYRMPQLAALARQAGFHIVRKTHLGFFIFPAFAVRKLLNRRWLRASGEAKKALVASQIRHTSGSVLLDWLLGLELAVGRWVPYPWGIRCVLVVRKPLS